MSQKADETAGCKLQDTYTARASGASGGFHLAEYITNILNFCKIQNLLLT